MITILLLNNGRLKSRRLYARDETNLKNFIPVAPVALFSMILIISVSQSAQSLSASSICFCALLGYCQAQVSISKSTWQDKNHPETACWVLENAVLKVTILEKGAWIVSIVDKATSGEFVTNTEGKVWYSNGIYDRHATQGKVSYRLNDPQHLVNQLYRVEKINHKGVSCRIETPQIKIVRNMSLHPKLPKLRIDLSFSYFLK